MANLFDGIDDIDWQALKLGKIPQALRDLLSDDDEIRKSAFSIISERLYDRVPDGGLISKDLIFVLPYLFRLLSSPDYPYKVELLRLIRLGRYSIEVSQHEEICKMYMSHHELFLSLLYSDDLRTAITTAKVVCSTFHEVFYEFKYENSYQMIETEHNQLIDVIQRILAFPTSPELKEALFEEGYIVSLALMEKYDEETDIYSPCLSDDKINLFIETIKNVAIGSPPSMLRIDAAHAITMFSEHMETPEIILTILSEPYIYPDEYRIAFESMYTERYKNLKHAQSNSLKGLKRAGEYGISTLINLIEGIADESTISDLMRTLWDVTKLKTQPHDMRGKQLLLHNFILLSAQQIKAIETTVKSDIFWQTYPLHMKYIYGSFYIPDTRVSVYFQLELDREKLRDMLENSLAL